MESYKKMRIIGGFLKGKSLNFLKNLTTRPLKDSVRENIFNILNHSKLINIRVEKSKILDLYSGVGSFGIECISRGAQKVTFIEKDKKASEILEKNLKQLSIHNKVEVFNNRIEVELEKQRRNKFNIFFLDPPYADKDFTQNLDSIKKNKLFKTKHIVIIHRDRKSKDDLENFLNTILVKQYGRSKIIFGLFN